MVSLKDLLERPGRHGDQNGRCLGKTAAEEALVTEAKKRRRA